MGGQAAATSAVRKANPVEFAEKTFMFRESSRTLELLTQRLLPKARQSLEVAQSGYVSGKVDFLNLLDAERTLLGFQLSEVEARVQRELSLWGLTQEQVDDLVRNKQVSDRITLFSPIQGTVMEKMVVQKAMVKPGEMLYRLANLESVWVYLDIYEYELPWVAAEKVFNPNGVVSPYHRRAATPLGLFPFAHISQGSSCLATLGFAPEPLWDSPEFPKDISP